MNKILRDKGGIVKVAAVVAVSMTFVFGTAMLTYVQAANNPDSSLWLEIYGEEGQENLYVKLKIHGYSLHKDFAIFHYILSVENGYSEDINVTQIWVSAWSGPMNGANNGDPSVMYGEDSKEDVDIPALEVETFRLNHKAYNYDKLFEDDRVYVYYYVYWMHGTENHFKSGWVPVDAEDYWQKLWE